MTDMETRSGPGPRESTECTNQSLQEAARRAGFADKLAVKGFAGVTSREVGLAVKELIKEGEMSLTRPKTAEANAPSDALDGYEVAQELGILDQYLAGDGWRSFTPRDMFRFSEALLLRKRKNTEP